MQEISREKKLDIVIQCGMKTAINLDVTLNLNNCSHKPNHAHPTSLKKPPQ